MGFDSRTYLQGSFVAGNEFEKLAKESELLIASGRPQATNVTTTDATVTTLATIRLENSRAHLIQAMVIARRVGGSAGAANDSAVYVLRGAYKMVSNTPVAIGGTTPQQDFVDESQAGWEATLDISGNDVRIRVTGATNNTIDWAAYIQIFSTKT